MLMNYTPLWIKTDYSILSSLIKIDDLISMLKSLEIKSAAICDDNLYGAMEFYTKCIKNDIKPIIGLEVNLEETILLYAKNYAGYQNLCNIMTLLNEEKLTYENIVNYINDIIVADIIQFFSGDTGFHIRSDHLQYFCRQPAGHTHFFDFFRGFNNDGHNISLN